MEIAIMLAAALFGFLGAFCGALAAERLRKERKEQPPKELSAGEKRTTTQAAEPAPDMGDLQRQMRNLMGYDGTKNGQVKRKEGEGHGAE